MFFTDLSYFNANCHTFDPRLSYFSENGLATLIIHLDVTHNVPSVRIRVVLVAASSTSRRRRSGCL